ncbi:MAG TPA: DUF952 domain-containing protein [Planctomycetaceae bacterium]|nr:DUF952 domain-containing protein [Planctomycetaceae bacterium]
MAAQVIYKILTADQWESFSSTGTFDGAPVDLADGYIHFSTAEQLPETAAKHFDGLRDLVVVGVLVERAGEALKWEKSRGGALFPHLYRSLETADVHSQCALTDWQQ